MNGIFTISSVLSRQGRAMLQSTPDIFIQIVNPRSLPALAGHEATSQEGRDLWLTNKLLNLSHKNLMYFWKKSGGLNCPVSNQN